MKNAIYKGILTAEGTNAYLLTQNSAKLLEGERIWSGYLKHFRGRKVCARHLPQRDYETGQNIIIMWPDEETTEEPFVELYFNQRLAKYRTSFLGHLAINVNGEIFNFSHLLNENEIMKHEDYFFRPALGEFAPHPVSGRYNVDNPQKPYYDKFGRLFMRTIHVLKITGLDTKILARIFHGQLEAIRNTPPDPKDPQKYRDFNILTNSCSTIIRNGFKKYGFKNITGMFPRDIFVNVCYYFLVQEKDKRIKAARRTLPQLMVDEAAPSVLPPLMNPQNRWKERQLRKLGI
ncbi:MAG TPA: hypothetical protein P5294_07325 [Smithellaceae bacterium]|nr:hypothetical protein [Smithellaceae bacterium]HRS90228.1 hypothetical protein [Smithellaceae bacterium]HRV26331.1 hypothetical protein [Smithellaceae bacterium]